MPNEDWSLSSAVYQVGHGGPNKRTLSAISYLREVLSRVDDHEESEQEYAKAETGQMLLNHVITARGFTNLDESTVKE